MELHHPTVLKTGTYFVAGPKSIHRCRRYPTKFNSGRDIPLKAWGLDTLSWDVPFLRVHTSRGTGCVPRFVEKERRPPLRHQSIRSGGNLRVFENLAQTLVTVDAS